MYLQFMVLYINPVFRLPEFIVGILAFKINFFGLASIILQISSHKLFLR